jgi:hypothetical protein
VKDGSEGRKAGRKEGRKEGEVKVGWGREREKKKERGGGGERGSR